MIHGKLFNYSSVVAKQCAVDVSFFYFVFQMTTIDEVRCKSSFASNASSWKTAKIAIKNQRNLWCVTKAVLYEDNLRSTFDGNQNEISKNKKSNFKHVLFICHRFYCYFSSSSTLRQLSPFSTEWFSVYFSVAIS